MMRRRDNVYGRMSENSKKTTASTSREEQVAEMIEWEMRPGGMLVQKTTRSPDFSASNLRLRVAFGLLRYEISVNSQATFGEVKKVLAGKTGIEAGDQRLLFKGKERENGGYLDTCGVKDKSKINMMEDPLSIERRYIQIRRNANIQIAHRAILDASMEIDGLANQISAIEKSITNGTKVAEVQITTLIEMLMRQAIKLDNITTEEEASAHKSLQEKRVQKCVEILDALKISNANLNPVIISTKWETFDPSPTTAHWEIFD